MPDRIVVIGVVGDRPAVTPPTEVALWVGGRRHVDALVPAGAAAVVLGDVGAALAAIESDPGTVCVLASGDPGFFGIVRALAARFGSDRLDVHPAPSSVALAFARLGLPWDDAVVVSAHGRPLADAVAAVSAVTARPVAVLLAPDAPAEAVAKELLALGVAGDRPAAVAERLGGTDERVVRGTVESVAAAAWDPLAVLVLPSADMRDRVLAWGADESAYSHRAGMVTKAEVRAVVLGKLALPATGVLWDVGAGSGSVALEAAALCPGLRVIAVERDAEHLRANVGASTSAVEVIEGEAPAVLPSLPDPDRVFVGGGGLDVLDAALTRLRPGGVVVATFAALDRAAAAFERLGALVEVSVSRGERLPDGGVRLAAHNPVFVAWGPA